MSNRLAGESSPYLLAHSENPVDWFPWGREALEKARLEDKPIFLSIGYSACHWCHVMERESFEDPATAEILNGSFVSIKVDKEERPDLDDIYMSSVQLITGRGGWPLSVFLLPDTTPFFGGTYFPPEAKAGRYKMQSFPRLLRRIARVFQENREELESSGNEIARRLKQHGSQVVSEKEPPPDESILDISIDAIAAVHDPVHGGFEGAPKFPMPMVLEFLLRHGSRKALEMAMFTMENMARGGIQDHIGGGFHRYSTDSLWMVPHFEKMLYDNAMLSRVYVEAYQITGKKLFAETAEKTLDFLLREMRHPEGGFYSSLDADSPARSGNMEEGAFYTWSKNELEGLLGSGAGEFCNFYNVRSDGVFKGRNILYTGCSVAAPEGLPEQRKTLLQAREKRPRPFLDTKIISAWNGMAIRALAAASRPLGRSEYLDSAIEASESVMKKLRNSRGELFRSWKDGEVSCKGFLQDYSLVASGLLEVHAATGEDRFFYEAASLVDSMLLRFRDGKTGLLNNSGKGNEELFLKTSNPMDSAVPSGLSSAAEVLFRLWTASGEDRYLNQGTAIVSRYSETMKVAPSGFGRMLSALLFSTADTRRVSISGPDRKQFLDILGDNFSPFTVLVPGGSDEEGETSAVICGKGFCLPPVRDTEKFTTLIKGPGFRRTPE